LEVCQLSSHQKRKEDIYRKRADRKKLLDCDSIKNQLMNNYVREDSGVGGRIEILYDVLNKRFKFDVKKEENLPCV
jgi:hypothetical protein